MNTKKHYPTKPMLITAAIVVFLAIAAGGWCLLGPSRLLPSAPDGLPKAGSVKAIDSANAVHDPTWFTGIYAKGFRLYILHSTAWGTCDPWQNTQSQLRMALAAGLRVAAYTRDPNCWQGGIAATGKYKDKLQFFAIDAESNPGVPATRAMVDGIKSMGVRPVIYTGASMWPKLQGDTANDFSDVPLWDTDTSQFAYGDGKADYRAPTPVEYGGWNTPTTMRIGVQQQFEYNLDGILVDLNSFSAEFLR